MRINGLTAKVEHCLEFYPETRNSDIKLTNCIWFVYYKGLLFKDNNGKWSVNLLNLYDLPREDNVKRIRARIQNEEMRFLPTILAVVRKRRINEEAWRVALGYNPPYTEVIT